jgi:hypothetical protein
VDKRILFPFASDRDFHQGYAWAMELASRIRGTLFFFTAIPEEVTDKVKQDVYLSLMRAQSDYLLYADTSKKGHEPVKTERLIEQGDYYASLISVLKKSRFDIAIIDPRAVALPTSAIEGMVEYSEGVIILPDQKGYTQPNEKPADEMEKKVTEDFYETLRRSDLYKLPSNFFRTLGQDKGLFNYLRGLFRKNPSQLL